MLKTTLWSGYYQYLHFQFKRLRQTGWLTCLKPHTIEVELWSGPRQPDWTCAFNHWIRHLVERVQGLEETLDPMERSSWHLQNFWLDAETYTALGCFPCGRSGCFPLLYVYMRNSYVRIDVCWWCKVQWTSVGFICPAHLSLFFRC